MRPPIASLCVLLCACSGSPARRPAPSEPGRPTSVAPAPRESCVLPPEPSASLFALRYDGLGYLPHESARAVLLARGQPAPQYRVLDARTHCAVARGVAGPRVLDTTSLARTRITADALSLEGLASPGSYLVVLEDGARFGPIRVGDDVYATALPAVVSFLRTQRCGATTRAISQHEACHRYAAAAGAGRNAHSGDGIAVDDGYGGEVSRSVGPAVDVEGGWHDAGDYIKFVSTTTFVLAVDLLALRDHGDALRSHRAGEVYGPLRDELRWGLDWLERMVGGPTPYYQVSGPRDHVEFRDPAADTATPVDGYEQRPAFRFGIGHGANLLGRAAAAFALAAQVYADDPPFATRSLALARRLYGSARARPLPQSTYPPSFYSEASAHDDVAFAAALLAQITRETSFRSDALAEARQMDRDESDTLVWGDVSALARLETAQLFARESTERAEMLDRLREIAAPIEHTHTAPTGPGAAFHYALDHVGNGSVEESLGAAAICLAARRLGGGDACLDVARAQVHWLFGQNPFGVSFMIGATDRFPRHPHHSLAQATQASLLGAIVGGPSSLATVRRAHASDSMVPVPDATSAFATFSTEALAWDDDARNYVFNEPAIDFTAPLVFVLAELLDSP